MEPCLATNCFQEHELLHINEFYLDVYYRRCKLVWFFLFFHGLVPYLPFPRSEYFVLFHHRQKHFCSLPSFFHKKTSFCYSICKSFMLRLCLLFPRVSKFFTDGYHVYLMHAQNISFCYMYIIGKIFSFLHVSYHACLLFHGLVPYLPFSQSECFVLWQH